MPPALAQLQFHVVVFGQSEFVGLGDGFGVRGNHLSAELEKGTVLLLGSLGLLRYRFANGG